MKVFAFLALVLAGCGAAAQHGSAGGASAPAPAPAAAADHSRLVDTAASLPACNAAAEGWLVYLKDQSKFQVCAAGAWADVAIKGDKGDKGDAGAAGTAGKDGNDNHITATIGCFGQLGSTPESVGYSVSQMATGDIFASANIASNLIEASGSQFYSAKQKGADTAAVLITDDLEGAANGGFWTVSVDRTTLITTAAYQDSDGNLNFTMTPDKCTLNKYD